MMNSQQFTELLAGRCVLRPGAKVLVACSGGADSVALLLSFAAVQATYPLSLVCVHVEHGIRGAASLSDAEFVRELCEEEGIPFRLCPVNVPDLAKKAHIGLEAAARQLRYEALRRVLREEAADVIALAHHRRDQAETVLMHLMRGCDMDALSGMAWRERDLIRPFLGTDPEELRTCVRQMGHDWREDATNTDTAYTRNRIRLRLLPEMEKIYPGAETAICRLSEAAARDRAYFADEIKGLHLRSLIFPFPYGLALPVRVLDRLRPAVLSRALVWLIARAGLPAQDRFALDRLVERVAEGRECALNLSGSGRARIWRGLLILVRPIQVREFGPIVSGNFENELGNFSVFPALPVEVGNGLNHQRFPSHLLEGAQFILPENPLPFTPFGREKETNTAEFLKKVPLPQEIRTRIPVLISRDGQVLWLAGVRPDECVRSGNCPGRIVSFGDSLNISGILRVAREQME